MASFRRLSGEPREGLDPRCFGKEGRARFALAAVLEVGVLCGTATLKGPDERGAGDPMELALLRLGQLAKIAREALLIAWP